MRKKAGFTLIEFIMVIVILGIMAGVGLPLMAEISQAWLLHKDTREIAESARIAIDRMMRDIRRAVSITSADTANLQFTDIDISVITFDISSTTLRRTEAAATNALADNVDSLSFTYYDDSDAQIATPVVTPSDIKRIEVDLTFSLGDTQFNIRSQVSPRRLQ